MHAQWHRAHSHRPVSIPSLQPLSPEFSHPPELSPLSTSSCHVPPKGKRSLSPASPQTAGLKNSVHLLPRILILSAVRHHHEPISLAQMENPFGSSQLCGQMSARLAERTLCSGSPEAGLQAVALAGSLPGGRGSLASRLTRMGRTCSCGCRTGAPEATPVPLPVAPPALSGDST